jgi:hypothetical protein
MIDGGTDTLTERRIDGQMDRLTDGHTHTERRKDGVMDIQTD